VVDRSNEEVVRADVEAHAAHDYDTVGRMRHTDWTTEWPESGERVRGHANDRAIIDNWPDAGRRSRRPYGVLSGSRRSRRKGALTGASRVQ
jgi:hypothetical protein